MGHDASKRDHRKNQPFSPSKSSSNTPGVAPTNAIRNYDLSNFAVITAIFNPVKFHTRYDHYRRFAQHMSNSGVNLYTVECIFESAPHFGLSRQNFEITRAGDRYHIQLMAPSIIWMKENLINIAVQRLPQNIEYVAWIDADVEFERLDWPQLAINELQRYPIVQLFELSYFLGPGGKKDILRRDYSFGYSIRHNKPIEPGHANGWYAHPGYAWAMRRSAFDKIGGLIDFCIIGSGDLHFAFALLHRIEDTLRPGLHKDYRSLAITWGNNVAQVAQKGNNVSYVPVNLWHYWHGERKDRHYVDRWTILEKHHFSPLKDLEKNDETSLIRLANKRNFGRPELVAQMEAFERDIVAYFISRNEDNNVKIDQAQRPPPVKSRPFVAGKTQPRRGGLKQTNIPPRKWTGTGATPHIWSSGPSGTHVDDEHPFWDQCTCPGHHHHHDNHGCPCSSHHTDDQHCWNPTGHDEDHHHHHHHTDDPFGGHHSSHEHEHHGDHPYDYSSGGHDYDHSSGDHHHDYSSGGQNQDYSSGGYQYDYSSGGGYDYQSGAGSGDTGYSGPGSFY